MSLEAAIAENTKAHLAVAEALAKNNARLDQVIAGQQAAIAKIEAKAGSGTTAKADAPKTDKKADAPKTDKKADAPKTEPKVEAKTETPAAKTFVPAEITDDMLRAHGAEYLGKADPADTARAERGANLKALMAEFGVSTLVGDTGIADQEDRKRAWWYIARWKANKPVDFKATIDLSADPAADGGAAPEADEFGLG